MSDIFSSKNEKFGNKTIYTTGAHLIPVKSVDGKWFWSVSCFEDDTFCDGELFNPAFISSDKLENLENISDEEYNHEFYTGHGFKCDECETPLSEFNYQNNGGLCSTCVNKIQ